jgi:NPCBM/NEW2 domain/Chitobiase/beta-hexosaminidase C-terminal domain
MISLRRMVRLLLLVGSLFLACSGGMNQPGELKAAELALTFQTRDAATGTIQRTPVRVDPHRVGVIAVDVWNYHWCKTATMRVDALVPRIDQALNAARDLGMTVMLCPSDVVDNYVGYPQREAVFALPKVAVPSLVDVTCPPVPDAGGCACGAERCAVNYGWDGMHPGLRIGAGDLMPDTQAEVYAICQKYHLTHLIYVGFHTQVCLLGKPMGLKAMKSAGLTCVLARDLTDAHPGYDPARNFTPDLNTEQVIEHFEKHLAPTLHFQEELANIGRWDPRWVLDPVRIAPWGTPQRPHLFEQPIVVTLTVPFQPGADIRYTLDGSAPTAGSLKYTKPLTLTRTTNLRASAFREGIAVCRESEGAFARMNPMPPPPDVYLGDLTPIRNVGFGHTYGGVVRYSGMTQAPRTDHSNLGNDIRINRKKYAHGIGVHAPCELAYEIKPGYTRFVGLAGADENLISASNGSNLARYPSVVFKVFIDGSEAAASPVMRVQSLAWRFDVALPEGARIISLAVTDAGDGSREDFADWADAGFLVRK